MMSNGPNNCAYYNKFHEYHPLLNDLPQLLKKDTQASFDWICNVSNQMGLPSKFLEIIGNSLPTSSGITLSIKCPIQKFDRTIVCPYRIWNGSAQAYYELLFIPVTHSPNEELVNFHHFKYLPVEDS